MFERIKFLPVMIAMLVGFLGLKGLDLWTGTTLSLTPIGTARASEPAHEPPASESHEDASPEAGQGQDDDIAPNDDYLSAADVDIRNSMEDRSAKLEAWEEELKIQQNMLTVAEKRIETRIAELQALKESLRQIAGELDDKEQADLLRLVKVYETMKPKAAAPIMERLDEETRLSIAAKMKTVKLAAVLTYMDENAAQELTRQLMLRSDISDEFNLLPAAAGQGADGGEPGEPEL